MYDVFNNFLATDTWHSQHDNDVKRFNQALSKIVSDPRFSADELKHHFEHQLGDRATVFQTAIDSYHARADAVRDYLQAV